MQDRSILFVGFGKIASRVAAQLPKGLRIHAIARSEREVDQRIHYARADVGDVQALASVMPEQVDIVVYCLSPGRRDQASYRSTYVEGLKNVLSALPGENPPRRVFFISSTSVYHQDDGSVVDECSLTEPASYSGQTICEAERLLKEHPVPSTCVRFSGIYGGKRSQLVDQVLSGKRAASRISHLSNRIHEDDCVGFLVHLIEMEMNGAKLHSCYLASDSCPVDVSEVVRFIAREHGVAVVTSDEPPPRRAGSKHCSNARMLETGYRLKYPSYREGYALKESTG